MGVTRDVPNAPCTLDWVAERFKNIIRGILTLELIIAGGFLAFYALIGARFEHALMNVEGIIALSFLVLLILGGG